MENNLIDIATITITDTEFDEENEGVVIVKSLGRTKIGLGVSQKYNGDATLWMKESEARHIIAALEDAIKAMKSG